MRGAGDGKGGRRLLTFCLIISIVFMSGHGHALKSLAGLGTVPVMMHDYIYLI